MEKGKKEGNAKEAERRDSGKGERTKERAMMVLRPAAMARLGWAGGERY